MKKVAFTLIELLVLISIIAMLLSILMPALKIAKRKAANPVYLTNAGNLSLGWYMYHNENNEWLVGGITSKKYPWIKDPHYADGTPISQSQISVSSPEITDDHETRLIQAGALYDYIQVPPINHGDSSVSFIDQRLS